MSFATDEARQKASPRRLTPLSRGAGEIVSGLGPTEQIDHGCDLGQRPAVLAGVLVLVGEQLVMAALATPPRTRH
jgi:hypothetical protein